jgi:hypothetical protein
MSGMVGSLPEILKFEKDRYLMQCKKTGGTAAGFRKHCVTCHDEEPAKFAKLQREAFLEAATKCWQAQPRKRGPDLFDISGITVPEYLTRSIGFVDGDDIDDESEEKFEKVHYKFATVSDLYADANIKLRKAGQASAAANRLYTAADEARRRARGKMDALLSALHDSSKA